MHRARSLRRVRHAAVAALISLVTAALPTLAQQPQVVRSTAPPAWGPSMRLVEEVRIGRLDGAEEYLFGEVEAVAVGKAGMIYVADAQVPIIRSYDAQGRFVRNIGRKGGGPGEYESIGGMRALSDGRLALWDNRNQRITVYTSAGEVSDTYRVVSPLFASDIFQVDTAGRFYVRGTIGELHEGEDWQEGWIRVARTGQVMDTIPIPSVPRQSGSFVLSTPSGYDRPFTRELVTTMSSLGYLITGKNDGYAFDQHRPGAPVLRIERAHRPLPVGRAEHAEWQAWVEFFQQAALNRPPPGRSPTVMGAQPMRYEIPDTKPAFSELRTDSQGRIWVRRYVAAVSHPGPERPAGDKRPRRVWREAPTFDVFEPGGRLLGTVTFPWTSYFHDAIDQRIWATVRGESDETYIVRYRLETASR
jgi:hypothetical protein